MSLKQKIFQTLGELSIPILGFYWWKWDLNFILLFYCFDLFAFQLFTYLKWRKVVAFRGVQHGSPTLFFSLLFLIGLFVILLLEWGITFIYPSIDLTQSAIDFFRYSEWGVPQIVLLIPLVLFANFQQYKMLFLKTGKFRIISESILKGNAFFSLFTLLIAAVVFLLLAFIGLNNANTWLWMIVISKAVFDLLLFPAWEKRTKNN